MPGATFISFATGTGNRDYFLLDEKTMFGIARPRMRVHYFLDDTNSVNKCRTYISLPTAPKTSWNADLKFWALSTHVFERGIDILCLETG